jgi:hypothetical protein
MVEKRLKLLREVYAIDDGVTLNGIVEAIASGKATPLPSAVTEALKDGHTKAVALKYVEQLRVDANTRRKA